MNDIDWDKALEVLYALTDAINSTGGVKKETIKDVRANLMVPVADLGFDLVIGEAYLLACKALKQKPKIKP